MEPAPQEIIRLCAEADDAGMRLDRFLAARLPDLSRSRLRALIDEGNVLWNSSRPRPRQAVSAGDDVEIRIPPARPSSVEAEAIDVEIVHEDRHLAVIHKAHGMVVHPGAGHSGGTLVNALLHRWGSLSSIGGVERPGIVHRLDMDTSGLLVVARDDATHEHLARQFADREVRKIYLAVVRGRPTPAAGTVRAAIGRHPVNRRKMAVLPEERGRKAVTDYRVAPPPASAPPDSSLVLCRLHTGRTHQIRVHLAHLGHPILGDPIYGGKSGKAPAVSRLMLHAFRLGFQHPATGEAMEFHASPPMAFTPWTPSEGWDELLANDT